MTRNRPADPLLHPNQGLTATDADRPRASIRFSTLHLIIASASCLPCDRAEVRPPRGVQVRGRRRSPGITGIPRPPRLSARPRASTTSCRAARERRELESASPPVLPKALVHISLSGSLHQAPRAPRSRARDRISRTAGDFRRPVFLASSRVRQPLSAPSCLLPKEWLPFVDAYRTLCFDPPSEVRDTFEALRFLKTAG